MKLEKSLLPLFAVGLFLTASVSFDLLDVMTLYDQKRILQVILLALLCVGGMLIWQDDVSRFFKLLPRWIRLSFTLGLLSGAVSALLAQYPRYAFLEWSTFVLLGWSGILLAATSRVQAGRFDHWALRILMALAVIISLKVLVSFVAVVIGQFPFSGTLLFDGVFSNRRFFGQTATLIMPILPLMLLRGNPSRAVFAGGFGLLAVWWALAILSGTRGTWAAMAIASVVLFLFARRMSYRWLLVQCCALITGLLLFFLLFVWLPGALSLNTLAHAKGVEDRLSDLSSLSGRGLIWSLAWQDIIHHPVLGIGPMQFASIRNPIAAHPHNVILQLAAEWGMPASLALLSPLAYGLIVSLNKSRISAGDTFVALRVCLNASLLGACVQAMVDGVVVVPYTQTLLMLVSGWLIGMHFRDKELPSQVPNRLVYALFPVLALGFLGWGVFPDIWHRAEITQAWLDHGNTLLPRFWAKGWIP